METMISNEIEETRGLNLESVDEIANSEDIQTDTVIQKVIADSEIVENYKKAIEEANFIELGNLKRSLEQDEKSLEDARETAKSLLKLKADLEKAERQDADTLSKKIEVANEEDAAMFDNLQDFLENYEESQNNIRTLRQKVEERLDEFKDVPKTTSFMTGLMLETIDKNLKRLEEKEADPNRKKKVSKMLENQKEIFKNRDSVEFILSKIPNYEIPMRRFVLDCLKPNAKRDIIPSIQKQVTKTFTTMFNTNQLSEFEKYLSTLYDDSTDSFFVQYLLYLIYCRELDHGKDYGNQKWIEVLIMNVLDITTDNYDLESGKDAYDEKLIQIRNSIQSHLIRYKKKKK